MRITFLLFLTLSSFLISCEDETTDLRKFGLDSHDYFFYNPGSYWVYKRDDDKFDTIRLIDVETSIVTDYKGDQEAEYRVDKFWSTANEEYFERTSKDSIIWVYNKNSGSTEIREIFKYTSKFHTFYSNFFNGDGYVDGICYVKAQGDSTYLGEVYPTKTYIGTVDAENYNDTTFVIHSQATTSSFAKGLGMVRYKYENSDTTFKLELVNFHLE